MAAFCAPAVGMSWLKSWLSPRAEAIAPPPPAQQSTQQHPQMWSDRTDRALQMLAQAEKAEMECRISGRDLAAKFEDGVQELLNAIKLEPDGVRSPPPRKKALVVRASVSCALAVRRSGRTRCDEKPSSSSSEQRLSSPLELRPPPLRHFSQFDPPLRLLVACCRSHLVQMRCRRLAVREVVRVVAGAAAAGGGWAGAVVGMVAGRWPLVGEGARVQRVASWTMPL